MKIVDVEVLPFEAGGKIGSQPYRRTHAALKVVTDEGWFAVRPSGTEEVYKLYAESFRDRQHLERIQGEAQALVARIFAAH